MEVNYRIEGARELQRKLRQFPGKMERKVYRGAVNRGGTPTLQKARSLSSSATVKKALTKRARHDAANGFFTVIVTVKGGVFRSQRTATRKRGTVYHPDEALRFYRFLELGTRHHAAKPFLGPALLATQNQFREKMRQEIETGIEKVART